MKYYGSVGFAETKETSTSVWTEVITERKYYGDVLRLISRVTNGEHLNNNVDVNNQISIVADPYAYENFSNIRYIVWQNSKWKVNSITVNFPRLVLEIGGLYNEE